MPCLAKSCRKGGAGSATKHFIYESWGANKPVVEVGAELTGGGGGPYVLR